MLQGAASFREQPAGTSASVSGSHSRSSCPRPIRRPTAWWDTSAPKKLRTGKPPSNAFVARAIPAIAESLKKQDQFKDYQISYHIDKTGTGNNEAGIEVVNEELGCKPWKDTLLGMGQCGIEIVNFGLWTFAPQISTPRFTYPQIQVWYIQGKDVQLKFRDAVLKPKFDWGKGHDGCGA